MKVKIVPRWDMDAVDVYVYDSGPGGRRLMRFLTLEDGQTAYRWDEFSEGTQVANPSLRLPTDVLGLLVGEANDYLPPSAATDAALKDARETRDRLLTLVEHTITSASN